MGQDTESRRTRAEALLNRDPKATPVLPTCDVQALVHDLQLHEIELEMQNAELRRAQMDLAASRDAYVELYDFAPVGYLTLDRSGRIIAANLTAATLLGVARNELCAGHQFAEYVSREAQDAWFMTWRHHLQGDAPKEWELALVRADLRPLQVQLAIVIRDRPDTDSWQCMLTLSDVTARRETEKSMRAGQAQLASVVDAVMDAILLVDEGHRILHVNPAAERAFNFSAGEALGQPVERFIPDLFRESVSTFAPEVGWPVPAAHVRGNFREGVAHRADGSEFPIEGTVSRFDGGAGPMYTAILRDVTHRKRNQDQIRQYVQNLEALNAELTRFNRVAVGRELRMVELKQEVNALSVAAGQPPRYPVAVDEEGGA